MSATLAGAIKALVEGSGLGLPVYRNGPPPRARLPYATVTEVTNAPERSGDFGDPTARAEVRTYAQIDVWQAEVDPATGRHVKDYGLVPRLTSVLRGAALPNVLGQRAYPLVIRASTSWPVPSGGDGVARTTLDVESLVVLPLVGEPT